jgi:hypothetical protein
MAVSRASSSFRFFTLIGSPWAPNPGVLVPLVCTPCLLLRHEGRSSTSYETSMSIYRTTRLHVPEDNILLRQSGQNFKFRIFWIARPWISSKAIFFFLFGCSGTESTITEASTDLLSLSYKPEGRGFETRWGEILNLPNPSGRIRPWGLLSLQQK